MAGSNQQAGKALLCTLSGMVVLGRADNFLGLAAETGSLWPFHFNRSIGALIGLVVLARIMRLGLCNVASGVFISIWSRATEPRIT